MHIFGLIKNQEENAVFIIEPAKWIKNLNKILIIESKLSLLKLCKLRWSMVYIFCK